MNRWLRVILALLLVAASASPTLAQREAGFEPVPAQNLSDGTLTVPADAYSGAS